MKIRFVLFIACIYIFTLDCNSNNYEEMLINHVQDCIALAIQGKSKITQEILEIEGMSSAKNRHFLNNLCSLPNTNYLEIGVWNGSTFVAALYGNGSNIVNATAIDDWSEFGEPREFFLQNCKCLEGAKYKLYEQNCFSINKAAVFNSPINIYFYDGGHTAYDQELAFTYFDDIFAPVFIAVVDDWNHIDVQIGTSKAFKKLGYTVLYEQVLPARFNQDRLLWWNGLYVAVIKKPGKTLREKLSRYIIA